MVNYRKYMFDNFVVEEDKEELVEPELPENPTEAINDETSFSEQEEASEAIVEDITSAETQPEAPLEQEAEDIAPVAEETPQIIEKTYSEEDLKEAVHQAEEEAYDRARREEAANEEQKQTMLLEDIRNKLMAIVVGLEEKRAEVELNGLRFAVEVVSKILPSLEKQQAEAEVKKFLADNFANFSKQETLSFAFHPETIGLVANSIGKLAEQNDFEGKISVHKDDSLGVSDCRVEWKCGGVERNTGKILEKVESLIESNTQERENG